MIDTSRFAPRKAFRSDDAPSLAKASVAKSKHLVIAAHGDDDGLDDDLDVDILYTPPVPRQHLTARQSYVHTR